MGSVGRLKNLLFVILSGAKNLARAETARVGDPSLRSG